MLGTLPAVVWDNKVGLLEDTTIPNGTHALVTLLTKGDDLEYWRIASQESIEALWNNKEDEDCAQMLKE